MKWVPPAGRVLVLAPHADDETLGCGGALILHARRGDPVQIVVVTDGAKGDRRGLTRNLVAARRREASRAAAVLGVPAPEFWDFPDGALTGARGLTRRISALLEDFRPRVLYRPGTDDPHPDHRALGRAVERALNAVRPPRLSDCRYEIKGAPLPTAVLDISADFPRKRRALAAYRSQRPYLEPRLIQRLNAARGLLRGVRYGEGFRVDTR
jgi:LmbE family N-acetylglucosaminyl deacetylase